MTLTRSEMMSRVRGRDTRPEIEVRKALHAAGFRFRLHRSDLPGKPDITFPKYRTVLFVNGCFWHQHPGCARAKRPASNRDFWNKKLTDNVARDTRNIRALQDIGWRVIVLWECQIREVRWADALFLKIRSTESASNEVKEIDTDACPLSSRFS